MYIIMHNPSGEPVATFLSRVRADDFMSALSKPADYVLFQRADEHGSAYAERNRDSILNDLRYIAETKKISAIKLYRAIFGVGLTEAKAVIEGANPSF